MVYSAYQFSKQTPPPSWCRKLDPILASSNPPTHGSLHNTQQYTVIEGNEKILPVENYIAMLVPFCITNTKLGLVEEDFS